MKKIVYILQILFVVLLFGACEQEELKVTLNTGKDIPFSLKLTNKKVASRAAYYTEMGATGYNENVINRADVYFYKDKNDNAVYKVSKTWDTPQEQSVTMDGTIPSELIEGISSLYAYVIVNGPVITGTDTKITTLKQIEIEADFSTYVASTTERSDYSQIEFVMDGENSVTYDATAKKVSGTITLKRAASKISLFITNLDDYKDGEGNIWSPLNEGMSISFYNGVAASRINVSGSFNDRTSDNYFSLSDNPNTDNDNVRFALTQAASDNTETTNINESTAWTHFPFYSYSSNWGRETNPDKEAYLSLRIYWAKTKDANGNVIDNNKNDHYGQRKVRTHILVMER